MEDSLRIVGPVALARPRGAHRFEAFSPKLARRMTFYRRPMLEQWVLLEADPAAVTFCERPGYVLIDGQQRLADFWVRYIDRQELVILSELKVEIDETVSRCDLNGKALPIRRVTSADLAATRVWIDNWQRMLPYLVANRHLISPTLSRSIERFVRKSQRLLAIEREFSTGDPVLVRAALFGLLHSGLVSAPELRMQPLSLLTSFVASGVES
jgi:hypothetical protein